MVRKQHVSAPKTEGNAPSEKASQKEKEIRARGGNQC